MKKYLILTLVSFLILSCASNQTCATYSKKLNKKERKNW
jgi:uncharacterized protein YcfL